jgi:hypothetical protein
MEEPLFDRFRLRAPDQKYWPCKSNSVRLSSFASRAKARWRPSGCRPGFWPQGQLGQSTPVLPDAAPARPQALASRAAQRVLGTSPTNTADRPAAPRGHADGAPESTGPRTRSTPGSPEP